MRKFLLLTSLLFSIVCAQAQTTYTWNVASGDFDAASSWSPATRPPGGAANDILVFDGNALIVATGAATATVTNVPSRETIGKLLITNSCAVTFSSSIGAVTGTGTIARTTTAVTGTGTSFNTTFVVGDVVNLIAAANEVAGVTTATAMTTTGSGTVAAGSAYSIFSRIAISGGSNAFSIAAGSSLTISATSSISLYIAAGSTGSISGALTFSGGAHRLNVNDASGVTFNSGGIFTQGTGFSGNAFTTTTATANTVIFASGSTCSVAAGSNPFALTAPASKVVFNSGSLFTQTAGAPSFSGRTYADFTLNTGNAQSVTGGTATSVNNLTVTGNSTLNWNMTGTPGHAIKGNITVNTGSTLNFTPATAGTTNLSGSALQSITSTNAITINNLATIVNGNTTGIALTPNTFVTIATGGTLNLNANPLTLQSTSAGTASIGAVNGTLSGATNVTVERYLAAKRSWRLITSPVNSTQTINAAWQEGAGGTLNDPNPGFGTFMVGSSTANGFDIAGSTTSILTYDGTNLNAAANTTAVVSSNAAYFLFSIGSRSVNPSAGGATSTVLRSAGTVRTGSQPATVNAAGYTLVGNPYPSAVDFSAVTRSTTVPNSFYAWDINLGTYGGYVLITNGVSVPSSPSGLTNIIPSGAAIFVQSDGTTTGTVTFTEASKGGSGSGTFSNFPAELRSTAHNFRVNLTDGTSNLLDGVMASYAPGYSNNVDAGDANKLFNFYENIALSRAGKQLIVEQRSDIVAKDTLFVQLSGVKTATYNLQINPADFNEPGMTAYLDDAYAHTRTSLDMSQISNISFTTNAADPTTYKNRFDIAFIPVVTAPNTAPITAAVGVIAYPNPVTQKQVNLSFAAGLPVGNYNITMANSVGQVMQKDNMIYYGTAANKVLSADYTPGVYIVNVRSAGYRQSIKVIIN